MEEVYHLIDEKQLLVRKKMGSFIEKILHYYGVIFQHDRFKKIIYGEDGYLTPIEEKIKRIYDSYTYLLSNFQSPVTEGLLKRFYYLWFEREFNSFRALKLVTIYFNLRELAPIEQAAEFHMQVYSELKECEEMDRVIISLIVLNFVFVRNGIPCIHILYGDFKEYEQAKNEFLKRNKEAMFLFLLKVLKKNTYLSSSFYDSLTPLTRSMVIQMLNENKEQIKNSYAVQALWLYGSFVKGIERFDSDVDLLVRLSLDLTQEERKEKVKGLTEYLQAIFHRFVDIHEVYEYIPDEMVKEATKLKKII